MSPQGSDVHSPVTLLSGVPWLNLGMLDQHTMDAYLTLNDFNKYNGVFSSSLISN